MSVVVPSGISSCFHVSFRKVSSELLVIIPLSKFSLVQLFCTLFCEWIFTTQRKNWTHIYFSSAQLLFKPCFLWVSNLMPNLGIELIFSYFKHGFYWFVSLPIRSNIQLFCTVQIQSTPHFPWVWIFTTRPSEFTITLFVLLGSVTPCFPWIRIFTTLPSDWTDIHFICSTQLLQTLFLLSFSF